MKQLYIIMLICCSTLQMQAQVINKLTGCIKDSNHTTIEGATVIVQKMDSTFIAGTITDKSGIFSFTNIEIPYRLIIQHLAYENYMLSSSQENLGDIILKETDNLLNEVVVKAERPIAKFENSRLTYDVSYIKDDKIVSNAHDLLKELPSITSMDGDNLSLAGTSNTTILISGKPSNLSQSQLIDYLKALPADKVIKVEVLYTANHQLHTKGPAINVILKKENKQTFNGQLQTGYKNKHTNSWNSTGSFFMSNPSWEFDLMYSFRNNNSLSKEDTESMHTVGNEIHDIHYTNREKDTENRHHVFSRVGYNFANNDYIELAYTGQFSPKDQNTIESASNRFMQSHSFEDGNNKLHDVSLLYQTKDGFKFGGEYTHYNNGSQQRMKYDDKTVSTDIFNYRKDQSIKRMKVYADLNHDLKRNWTLTYGASYHFANNKNEQRNDDVLNGGTEDYQTTSETKEHSANVYIGIQKNFWEGKLSANLSLADEYYKINDYEKNELIPTASLTYVPSRNHSWQLSYYSLKSYPSYWERQDFLNYKNEYEAYIGNPLLKPATTNVLNFFYTLKSKYMFQVSYYRVDDFFVTQSFQSTDELKLIYKKFNIEYSSCWNIMAILPIKFKQWYSSNLIIQAFNERYKSNDWFGYAYDRSKWSGGITANNTFTLSRRPQITANLNFFYNTSTNQGIWDLDGRWSVDAGMKCTFANNKAIISLQGNDIFETIYPLIKTDFETQDLVSDRNFYRRNITLNFTYKFNGYKNRKQQQIDTSRFGVDL